MHGSPDVIERFERRGCASGTSEEARILEAVYRAMPSRKFLPIFSDMRPIVWR